MRIAETVEIGFNKSFMLQIDEANGICMKGVEWERAAVYAHVEEH